MTRHALLSNSATPLTATALAAPLWAALATPEPEYQQAMLAASNAIALAAPPWASNRVGRAALHESSRAA